LVAIAGFWRSALGRNVGGHIEVVEDADASGIEVFGNRAANQVERASAAAGIWHESAAQTAFAHVVCRASTQIVTRASVVQILRLANATLGVADPSDAHLVVLAAVFGCAVAAADGITRIVDGARIVVIARFLLVSGESSTLATGSVARACETLVVEV
jgi:hypothetical protein